MTDDRSPPIDFAREGLAQLMAKTGDGVATRCNPAVHPFYKRLPQQDKSLKVAIATMWKPIVAATAILEHTARGSPSSHDPQYGC